MSSPREPCSDFQFCPWISANSIVNINTATSLQKSWKQFASKRKRSLRQGPCSNLGFKSILNTYINVYTYIYVIMLFFGGKNDLSRKQPLYTYIQSNKGCILNNICYQVRRIPVETAEMAAERLAQTVLCYGARCSHLWKIKYRHCKGKNTR